MRFCATKWLKESVKHVYMLTLFVASFVTFFVVIDPPGVAPMFATMTSRMSPSWRRFMAYKSVAVATGVLLAACCCF